MPLFFGTDYDVRLEVCWLFAAIPNDCLEAFFLPRRWCLGPAKLRIRRLPRAVRSGHRGGVCQV